MQLTRLIYFSENQISAANGSVMRVLRDILSASNRNNRIEGLTGALVFDDQWFLQVIEGERASVWQTFDRIREDERHSDLVVAQLVEVQARTFANWWMGLAVRSEKTESVFSRFASKGRFDPRCMGAGDLLSLVIALADCGLARELAEKRPETEKAAGSQLQGAP